LSAKIISEQHGRDVEGNDNNAVKILKGNLLGGNKENQEISEN
jgi:hypothetical protein